MSFSSDHSQVCEKYLLAFDVESCCMLFYICASDIIITVYYYILYICHWYFVIVAFQLHLKILPMPGPVNKAGVRRSIGKARDNCLKPTWADGLYVFWWSCPSHRIPWSWYTHLHENHKNQPNAGKYTSPMDPMVFDF